MTTHQKALYIITLSIMLLAGVVIGDKVNERDQQLLWQYEVDVIPRLNRENDRLRGLVGEKSLPALKKVKKELNNGC